MARTIQIAVENALALRVRQFTDLAGLLESLTLGQREIDRIRLFDWDGQVLAASSVRTVALAPQSDAIARVIETGTPGPGGDPWWGSKLGGVHLTRPIFGTRGSESLGPSPGGSRDCFCRTRR